MMSHDTSDCLPTLRLRGSAFNVGQQFGELARERVLLHLFNQKANMAKLDPAHPEWWRDEVQSYVPIYETLAPYFVEEMQGLARGADISFQDVLLINVRDELWSSRKAQPFEACTAFGCSGSLTWHGEPILGQTKDTGRLSKDLYVVTAIYQEGRPDLLQMACAGEFGVLGLSSAGMSLLGNSLTVHGHPRSGMPTSLFRRLALEAESTAEVIALVEKHGLACPGCYTIGDCTGTIVAIENTAHGHAIVPAQDGTLTHANHINAPEISEQEALTEPELGISHHRQTHLAAQLVAERGRLTPSMALRCLTDHANYPNSICRHSVSSRDFQTTAAVIIEPTRGSMYTIRGLPCQNWPVAHTL